MSRAKTVFKYIFRYLLLAGVCVLIFWFSSNDGRASSLQSGRITRLLCRLLSIDLSDLSYSTHTQAVYAVMSLLVRKAAHFSEYALLGAMSYYALFPVKNRGFRYLLAVLFSAFYACTDEFHQTFVAQRAGAVKDVLIDSAGAVTGAFVMLVLSVFVIALKIIRDSQEEPES